MPDDKQLLKIAELSEITGVPKDSIRYYVKEGLLPQPRKTSRNMAYYESSTYVPRIKLIKELQESRFLPLRVIKEILSADGGPTTVEELDTLTALDGRIFRDGVPGAPTKPLSRTQVSARTKISEDDLRQMEQTRLFTPRVQDGQAYYEPLDVQMAEIISKLRTSGFRPEFGFPVSNWRIYVDAMQALARRELGMFAQGVTGRRSADEVVTMAEEGVLEINRLLGCMREKLLLSLLHEYRLDMESGQRPAASDDDRP